MAPKRRRADTDSGQQKKPKAYNYAFEMNVNQVINCSFANWYDSFKHVTFKSQIVDIPDDVLAYLRSGSTIILPKSCQDELDAAMRLQRADLSDNDDDDDSWSSDTETEHSKGHRDTNNDDDDDSDSDGDTTHSNCLPKQYPVFDAFDERVRNALAAVGNKAFIKLNWSSPQDAVWSLNRLWCERLSDVYILLRASDFVSHDLHTPFDQCVPPFESPEAEREARASLRYTLVVREWIKISPSMEFRCFVRHNQLVGVCQRDCRSFYQVLLDGRDEILTRIRRFYREHIHAKFADDSFVFDVCLGKKSVKLLDFNPFGEVTDSLLFSWDELRESSNSGSSSRSSSTSSGSADAECASLELRLVESNLGIQSSAYRLYSQPTDLLNFEQLVDTLNSDSISDANNNSSNTNNSNNSGRSTADADDAARLDMLPGLIAKMNAKDAEHRS